MLKPRDEVSVCIKDVDLVIVIVTDIDNVLVLIVKQPERIPFILLPRLNCKDRAVTSGDRKRR